MAKQRLVPTRKTLTGSLLLIVILCAWGWVRAAWAGQVSPKPAAKQAASPAATSKRPARTTPSQAKHPRERRAKADAGALPSPAAKASLPVVAGRRDPFKRPPLPSALGQPGAGEATGPLPPGIRGLVISQLVLGGIVRQDATNKMIAVVTNYTKRAYFLRDNDAVYNGVVSKITPDAVYFKENVLDMNGRVNSREVVKRLGPAPGEGR
jgi:hypothetical protein